MDSTGVFLTAEDVRVGMVVALAVEGEHGPELVSNDQGQPSILKAFRDEMDADGIKLFDANFDGSLTGGGFTRLREAAPAARFMPVRTFTPNDAPPLTECVVVDGHVLPSLSGDSDDGEKVVTLSNRLCVLAPAYREGGRIYALPNRSILVPVGDIGAARPRRKIAAAC